MPSDFIIHHPMVILIIGMRGSGKTALGMVFSESFHFLNPDIPVYILNYPEDKRHLLPSWVKYADSIEDVPQNAFIIMDEASYRHHALMWRKDETLLMQSIIGRSRQRKQTIIFITHTARKFAITLILELDMLCVKEPSLFHSRFERAEIRNLLKDVYDEYQKININERNKYTYVFSNNYVGWIKTELCSFWSTDLSEAWKDVLIELPEKNED
jgi:hypothetical protein